ncbi:MAG: hypothetical protein J7K88_00275 [Candidatus Fermentibacteraceae bacterium]|nr:hypothetical protein [Candidatus Fermentibacteraceae bacterium]
MLGAEIGTRLNVKEDMFFDLTFTGEWVPIGGELTGEAEKDLSGIIIQDSRVF